MKGWFCYEKSSTSGWSPVVYYDKTFPSVLTNSFKHTRTKLVEIGEGFFDCDGTPHFAKLVATYQAPENPLLSTPEKETDDE